jgi:hypothetical protein
MNEGEVMSETLLEIKQRFQEVMFKETVKNKGGNFYDVFKITILYIRFTAGLYYNLEHVEFPKFFPDFFLSYSLYFEKKMKVGL